ncbi:dihydrolipoyllysine-residue acetyltransferase E2 component of pyruvate dehydrogenase complex [Luminiphilus syltensis NOR5-1B]|uniref:Dihydrolipoamide acetyltransferase component of pyruvate dehydrogenase complex n=1 Tax=Luminiphilus syltensis NOR5-1B TaxID=565045 RepID=B8KWX1_9GAMM|nr:dihydrolipoyllysine-residue acetyltransferase [Luminiphilus syltensis]EED34301.1 dihydrolipoyllysine-residue acetyltransferase E2 component of pyruvate dehydrogenase complex [Luminiphilus syltensis NOR5-1B]
MSKTNITVPDIGGAEGAEVVEVLVAVGDAIEQEQSLIVLESDKASMEIPSSHSGTVVELKVAVGDALSEGDIILVADTGESASAAEPSEADTEADTEAAPSDNESAPETASKDAEEDAAEEGADDAPAEDQERLVPVPDIGTDDDVELIEIVVAEGDAVEEGDSLVVLESDKASMEVPAPEAGVVTEILVKSGEQVRQGTDIVRLRVKAASPATPEPKPGSPEEPAKPDDTAVESTPPAASQSAAEPAAEPAAGPATADSSTGDLAYAGPAVRKLAREFGIDLGNVEGSGPKSRILKEDLHQFVSGSLKKEPGGPAGAGIPQVPGTDFAKFGEVDAQPRSRLDKLTAANMQRAWLNVPHVTQFDDADITDLETFRKSLKAEAEQRGTRITPIPFLLKACAAALNAHPKLKSSLADGGDTLVHRAYCHIGMAVDTPAGLVVPVVRDVDKKSLWELAEEVIELATLARDKKLRPDQMQGGVFSVSSLGNIGGKGFTPIVNTPEVAILGVSRASEQPVWDGAQFVPRTLLPLSLSYDHRVVNGGDAGRFLTDLVGLLGDLRRILL